MTTKEKFGRNLQQARKSRCLTQAALAELTGKAVETISNMERGRIAPSLDTLVDIANALGVEPGTLLQGIGEGRAAAQSSVEAPAVTALRLVVAELDQEAAEHVLGIIRLLTRRSPRRRTE